MIATQAGIVYRCFPLDATHDISADPMEASIDDTTWVALDYVEPVDYPPEIIAENTARPVAAGFTRYWWRALTGPAQTLPLAIGVNVIYGRLTDNPEIPHFAWTFSVGRYE